MATRNTYYFDTASFASATTIYTNADLSAIAPNGFYSDNVEVRQQTSGVLLAAQSCVTPTPVPTPVAPVPVPVPAAPVPTPTPTPTAPTAPPPVAAPIVAPIVAPVNIPAAPVAPPTTPPVFVPVSPPLAPPVAAPVVAPVVTGYFYNVKQCDTSQIDVLKGNQFFSNGTVVQYNQAGVTICGTIQQAVSQPSSKAGLINFSVNSCTDFRCSQ